MMASDSPAKLEAGQFVVGPRLKSFSPAPVLTLTCAAAALLGIAVTAACFYPGYMSPDSVEQLAQARSGIFTDWHPPILSFLWRFTDKVLPGPFGMLLLNNLLFWPGVALICYRCLGRAAAPVTLAFGLYPAVFGLLSTVWKDVAFGASMVLAFALLFNAQVARSKACLLFSALPLLYAFLVRHNSGPAVLPILFYAGWVSLNLFRGTASLRTSISLGMLAFGLLLAITVIVNRQLSAGRQTYITQTILLHDLTAISLSAGAILIPKSAWHNGSAPALDEVRNLYHPEELVTLFCGNPEMDPETHLEQTTDPANIAVLRNAWLTAVFKHPGAYLRHRARVFKSMLGIGGACYPYETGIFFNNFGIELRASKANRIAMHFLDTFRNGWMFQPWCYLVAVALMLSIFVGVHLVTRIPALALASSAILYEASYFFTGPSCDFRLSWFLVIAALMMGILLVRGLPWVSGPENQPNPPLNDPQGA